MGLTAERAVGWAFAKFGRRREAEILHRADGFAANADPCWGMINRQGSRLDGDTDGSGERPNAASILSARKMNTLPESINGLPNICGSERAVADAVRVGQENPVSRSGSPIDFNRVRSACAVALHMHQPLIPAGGSELNTAEIISNLDYMMRNQ